MGRRVDGRASAGTLRPLACELSCLHRADGSALWKAGATHVIAAVYGPLAPLNLSKEKEQAVVSVLIKSGRPDQAMLEYEWGDFLVNVLGACVDTSLYPRTVVQVVLQIIQSDGSTLACLLHAAVAALMDAGVELFYLPVATTCLIPSSGPVLLDPSSAEEGGAETTVLVLVNETSQSDKILGSHTVGPGCSLDKLLSCTQVASKTCPAIVTFWRLAVEQRVTREAQTLFSK
jgi:exosome complex component RRP41